MRETILKTEGLSKNFGGVQAIEEVSLEIKKGEVHAIVGENGAGKSTLVNIIAGALKQDQGKFFLKGQEQLFLSPTDAKVQGIVYIPQELNIVPGFNVIENIFLGSEQTYGIMGRLKNAEMKKEVQKILNRMGIDIDLKKSLKKLGIARQQIVSIAKALHQDASIIIMDEPTARLSIKESDTLFEMIEKLKNHGSTIIYISHKLEEIFKISDHITVLRNGKKVGDFKTSDISEEVLISKMVGTQVEEKYPKEENIKFDKEILRVENLSKKGIIKHINFGVKGGEILGIFGLVGSGRTELLKILFGVYEKDKGKVMIRGREKNLKSPEQAIKNGIAFIPEDRHGEGLVMNMNVMENSSLVELETFCKYGIVNGRKEKSAVKAICDYLKIKCRKINQPVKQLSGGNQQKVVLSKWVMGKPEIIFFDEASRGIDVPSKVEIFKLIKKMVRDKVAVVFVSSELPEVMALADRMLILHEGKQTALLNREDFSAEKIMFFATGGKNNGQKGKKRESQ